MKSNYQVSHMSRQNLDIAISWAVKEGWNPGLYDADCFYSTDPQGFFMGFLNGKPVACISAVSYGKDFGFLGFYIVKKEYRGKGYGIKIWNKAMKYLKTQNIGLDGVVAQQENYKKSGFKLAYRNIRYQGTAKKYKIKNPHIIPLNSIPFHTLLKYDNRFFPVSRPQFLKYWINEPESLALGIIKDNQLMGYGMIRKCVTGYKIGPLFADSYTIAEELFKEFNNYAVGEPIFLDIPEVNKLAVRFVDTYKMKPMFETARMYIKEFPTLPLHKIFGITTFELG